jgi:hypothetical protein
VQIAIALELLMMAPIRIGNLVAIEIERQLFWTQQPAGASAPGLSHG